MKPHIWYVGMGWWACATTLMLEHGIVALGETPMDAYLNFGGPI